MSNDLDRRNQKSGNNEPGYKWIDTVSGFDEIVDKMSQAKSIALDTESNSMFAYREQICLIQLNIDGHIYAIDPLALPKSTDLLDPFKPFLEDPAVPVFLHGGEYDVSCLKRDYNITLAGVFDSQQAASFLGWPKTGYGAVVERICGTKLDKKFARHDWTLRPIDAEALRYALDDVVFLPRVVASLQRELDLANLEEEVAIANEAVMQCPAHQPTFDPMSVHRLKGFRDLELGQQPLAFALHLWRNARAKQVDCPAGRLINDQALLSLVRTCFPATQSDGQFHHSPEQLVDIKIIEGKIGRAHLGRRVMVRAADLASTIRGAIEKAPLVPFNLQPPLPDLAERTREEQLKAWRRDEAKRRNVPLQVVLPAKALAHLKKHGAKRLDEVPQLGQKRITNYENCLRDACKA